MNITFELNNFIISQIIGFLALIIGLYAFLNKNDDRLKIFMTLQSFLLAVHFLFLGAMTPAAMSGISSIRNFFSLFANLKNLAFVFIAIYLGAMFFTFSGPVSLLTPIASSISTYAYFYTKGLLLRVLLLIVSFMWLLNNIFVFSIGPAIMEMIIVCANMITVIRMINDEQEKQIKSDFDDNI